MSAKVYPLKDRQADAVDPRDTVWLSASAGTGKTQVLSARVLRLLLRPGIEPSQILCLTFTKAGAAEMATRVNDVLAGWVRADDVALAQDLIAIGADPGPETVARARTRFAAVLDCPGGGLRIETIHAFSQWLLSAFPLEAGLAPGTRPMEDRDREILLRDTLAEMLLNAETAGDTTLIDALAMLALRTDQSGVERFLMACAEARPAWEGPGAWQPPLLPRVHRLLGLSSDHGEEHVRALCEDAAFDIGSLRRCLEAQLAWGTATARKFEEVAAPWLASGADVRLQLLDQLRAAVFTQKGDVKSLKSVEKHLPDYAEYAARVGESLDAVERARNLGELAQWLAPALTLGRAFALKWSEAKAREGLVDFDDQIHEAARLLKRSDMADWIRYKLDRRFDHILIDEAQDTNAAQWDVIDALTDEFFAGEGARGDRLRTLFVVGDYKQAIFRFQGTSPENFEAAKQRVKSRIEATRANFDALRGDAEIRPLQEYGLGRSYRTAQPVLDFVDAAIEAIGPREFGLKDDPEPHIGDNRPGQVVIWRAVGSTGDDPQDEEPEDEQSWLSRPDRRVADNIARQVQAWLRQGYPLAKGGARNAQAGDVMVLVRKRKELAGLIVARLHARGVPVAGVDRLRLGAPLAVRDLMAALRFAAQPNDDLSLACLLTSPLIGWSQGDLLAYGYRDRGMRLWDHLRGSSEPKPLAARAMLLDLLAEADYAPPQALLYWLLAGPWRGRRALVARLGKEANDPIDELLNAALAFSASNVPSLTGFIRWFDAGEGELKREAEQQGGLVRVMTVHGSKGLQAPIVILADTADDPDKSPPRTLELDEIDIATGIAARSLPMPGLRKEERLGPLAEAQEAAAKAEREEHWRLLYVAMTRAEEALFVAGALPAKKTEAPADSWYARLEPLVEDDWRDDDIWAAAKTWGTPAPVQDGMPAGATQAPLPLVPAWLTRPVAEEPRPPRPLAPSSLGEDDDAPDPPLPAGPGGDAGFAARRGVLIHRLLERLPELLPERRAEAGAKWLARQAADLSDAERAEMVAAAVATLANPDFADVFGPDALPEVPLAATVGGQVVAGTIDRLCLPAEPAAPIRVVDFKTARRPPTDIAAIPAAYIRQMAAYACALEAIHPGRRVECALLYTHAPRLFVLPDSLIGPEKARLRGA
ncbi:double-strand break repair helicase AddA [Croceicoccus naphthovorans]|uniref:DNA 3'-5' helicase n=1 Tax=Croceicoccus naphthovorans TaxID=1348774 RepID=A0A0G3XES1_9SPHN|nr:double-strand break repair helicase AddA [Croceicoccus naphthovorans]AKM09697.1 ATP-dependent exonuclease [Croceicoccus naphthovorans]MBB3990832.1 ATP-dependent helicase/nuclease subunit A [Croceicoccus naphthovorans]